MIKRINNISEIIEMTHWAIRQELVEMGESWRTKH